MDIYLKLILLTIVTIAVVNFLKFTFRYIKLNRLAELETNRLLYGVYSVRHLYSLTPSEFESWCAFLLRRLEYKDVVVTITKGDGGKDIICEKDGKRIYVECKKYLYRELAEHNKEMGCKDNINHQVVGREVLQKLVGAMVGDGIYKGIVITTSTFNSNAIKYVNGLPSKYEIELIDGKTLCKMYEEVIFDQLGITRRIPIIDMIK